MDTLLKWLVVMLLRCVDPFKPYGTRFFNALARLTVTVAIEVVILRRKDGRLEVLLFRRSPDDSAYPEMLHCPGSAMRPGESEADVLVRIAKRELGASFLGLPHFVGNFNHPSEARGHFFNPVYLCAVAEGGVGSWFPVDALPAEIVAHHRDSVIPMAVRAFVERERATGTAPMDE